MTDAGSSVTAFTAKVEMKAFLKRDRMRPTIHWVTNRLVGIKLPPHSRGKIVPRAHMPLTWAFKQLVK